MAAKIIILALAVCSASAHVCSPFFGQDNSQVAFSAPINVCGPTLSVAAASAPKFVVSGAPSFVPAPEIVSAAPSYVPAPEIVCSGPSFAPSQDFVSAAPSFVPSQDIVSAAPAFVQAPELVSGASFDFAAPAAAIAGSVSTGPSAAGKRIPVIQAPPVTLKAIESPIIRLPSPPIPEPKVIRHRCFCTKTIVRPQVIQRTINVPRIQRYLKQTYRPVVENVSYQARPVGSDARADDIVVRGSQAPVAAQIASPVAFTAGRFDEAPAFETSAAVDASTFDAPTFQAQSPCDAVVPTFSRCY